MASRKMTDNLNRKWQCQSCCRSFPTENDLDKHIETYKSRVQQLLLELQQAFAHTNAADDDCGTHDNDDSSGGDLSCPHIDCKHKPPYTELRSLQRHYPSHIRRNVTCPSCDGEFTIVRKYETHLVKCLKKQSDNSKKNDARKKKKRLHRQALDELEQKMSAGTGKEGVRGTRAISTESEVDQDEIADPELVGEPEGEVNAAAGHQDPEPQLFHPAPNNCAESCHMQSPTMSRNDGNSEFQPGYTENNSRLAYRYARGPVLLDNPMQWNVALEALYMTTPDTTAPVRYSQPGIGGQSSGHVGDGNLVTLYGAPFVNAVGVM